MNRFEKIVIDFNNATDRLEHALDRRTDDELIQAGCIQYFEFCFESSWNAIKIAMYEQGLPDCLSPKACLKQAFAMGWISDENVWLAM